MRLPSDTSGGWIPKPRKDNAVSTRMAPATTSVPLTMIGPRLLGRMRRKMIRVLDAPTARAASTNSRSRKDRATPRTSRARGTQAKAGMISTLGSQRAQEREAPHRQAMAEKAAEHEAPLAAHLDPELGQILGGTGLRRGQGPKVSHGGASGRDSRRARRPTD